MTGRAVGGLRSQKRASSEPRSKSTQAPLKAVKESAGGDLMGQEQQFQHKRNGETV